MTDRRYEKGAEYWSEIPATVDGVLGGYGFLSSTDVESSRRFLRPLFKKQGTQLAAALDCGAGIGRVTKYLLGPMGFKTVDLVEQDPAFCARARTLCEADLGPRLGQVYQQGLQSFQPGRTYDLVWCQWCLNYLSDQDLLLFLQRCRAALTPETGLLGVKENVLSSGSATEPDEEIWDPADAGITRSDKKFRSLFEAAGLQLVKKKKMVEMPAECFPVYMYALTASTINK